MKKFRFRLLVLVLAAVMLCGCTQIKQTTALLGSGETPYSDMVYTRPDMAGLEQILTDALLEAQGTEFDRVLECIYDFNEWYDDFYTNYSLADIRYCGDLTDLYWEEEYGFCAENGSAVEAALEELYCGLAQSPCREELEADAYFGPGGGAAEPVL